MKIIKKIIVGLLISILLFGCASKSDELKSNITKKFSVKTLDYTQDQMLVLAMSKIKKHEDLYTEVIWDQIVDVEENLSYRDVFLDDLKKFYREIVIFKNIAADTGVNLNEVENKRAKELARKFYEESVVNVEAIAQMKREDVEDLFLDFTLVDKVKKLLISKNVSEVSESDARVMDFFVIEVFDEALANELHEKLEAGENCAKLATKYSENSNIRQSLIINNESKNIKGILSTLENGEVSQVINENDKYYIYKCISSNDVGATQKNKNTIRLERESIYLVDVYNDFLRNNNIDINDSHFRNVAVKAFESKADIDFFKLLRENNNADV